eukprot:gene1441-1566_t
MSTSLTPVLNDNDTSKGSVVPNSFAAISQQEIQGQLTQELIQTKNYVEKLEALLKEHNIEVPLDLDSALEPVTKPLLGPRTVKPVVGGEEEQRPEDGDVEAAEPPRQHYGSSLNEINRMKLTTLCVPNDGSRRLTDADVEALQVEGYRSSYAAQFRSITVVICGT